MIKLLNRKSIPILMVVTMLGLTGCELQLQPLPADNTQAVAQAEPTAQPVEEPAADPTAEPAEEPTAEPVEEPAVDPTEAPAEEPTDAPTPTDVPPTSTAVPTPTVVPPTATVPPPPPTATDVPAPAQPIVTISTTSLRIRSGPGTEYSILGAAAQGESFVITGQAFNCGWYQITHPQFGTSWTSGSADFVTTTGVDCGQIPAVNPPPPPTAAPQPTAAPAEGSGQTSGNQAGNNQSGGGDLPSDKGCYLFQNQLGPELNVTITDANSGASVDNFRVAPSEEKPYCLWPGKYNVTVDAPPPWADLNDTINVTAGEHFFFPIRAR